MPVVPPDAFFVPIPPEAVLVPAEPDAGAPLVGAAAVATSAFSTDQYRGNGLGPPQAEAGPSGIVLSDQQASDQWNSQTLGEALYEFHSGLRIQTPMGGAAEKGDVVRVHADFWTKVIEWTFERHNAWPDCPHPDTGDPNLQLVYARVQPAKPFEGPNGARVYRVSGRYEYRLIKPLVEWGPFPTTTSPESKAVPADNTTPAFVFRRGMLSSY